MNFSHRCFTVNTIKNGLGKASKFTQSGTITERKNINKGNHLVRKSSCISRRIAKTTKDNLYIVFANHKTNRIFGTNPVLVVFEREKNLRDYLIRSKHYRDNNTINTPGTTSSY